MPPATKPYRIDDLESWQVALMNFCGQKSELEFRGPSFSGSVASWRVGGINIATMEHNLRHMTRPKVPEQSNRIRNVIILLQRQGRSTIIQDGISVDMNPGDAVLLDSAREFSGTFYNPTEQVLCYLSAADVFRNDGMTRLPRLRAHSGASLLGAVNNGLINTIVKHGADVGIYDGERARDMLVDMARKLLEAQRPPPPQDLGEPQDWRVRAYIDANLASPDLSPANIADGCNTSVRRLHRIFAHSKWSVCHWIREQRLKKCHADLKNSDLNHLTITQIAFRWGFNDSAHFSRSFRDLYGEPPSAIRKIYLEKV